jgi:hypothetical protein
MTNWDWVDTNYDLKLITNQIVVHGFHYKSVHIRNITAKMKTVYVNYVAMHVKNITLWIAIDRNKVSEWLQQGNLICPFAVSFH